MNLGDVDIYNILNNSSSVTSLLDTFNSDPALFNDIVIPSRFRGKNTVNIYQVGVLSGGFEYSQVNYSAHCRAETQGKAQEIAEAVFNVCNRHYENRSFLRCEILPVIKPVDDKDTYNYPVEILYRKK